MSEIGLAEISSMAEAAALIATLFVILYFYRKQMQSLSTGIETKILNDLGERMHAIAYLGIERPELIKVLNKTEISLEIVFAIIFYSPLHTFFICERGKC